MTGSMGAMYDLLVQAGRDSPVVGNQDGSYVTMKSNQGLVFGAATILSGKCGIRERLLPLAEDPAGFSGVFCDQGWSSLFMCLWRPE